MNQTLTFWDNLPSLFKHIGNALWACASSIVTIIILQVLSIIWCIIVGGSYGYGEGGLSEGVSIPMLTFITFFGVACVTDSWLTEKKGKSLRAQGGLWIVLGPTSLAFILMSFTFYPLKGKVVLIDQSEIKKWTLAIPFQGNIAVIRKEQRLQANMPATTKDSVRVRGDVSANFVITGNPAKWISDEAFQKNAEEELQKHFATTIAKMGAAEIQREIMIEFGVADQARLEELGLKWKPGSVVKVSNIHVAPPGS